MHLSPLAAQEVCVCGVNGVIIFVSVHVHVQVHVIVSKFRICVWLRKLVRVNGHNGADHSLQWGSG